MKMPMPFRLERRAVLRGAGVALALPWLEAMSSATRRAAAASPKRLVVFFTPNGTIRDAWNPTGTERSFTLNRIHKPLEPFKNDLVIIQGVDVVVAPKGGGDGHSRGIGCMLTGVELPFVTPVFNTYPKGISVDQEIVLKKSPPTKFPSMELGVMPSGGTVFNYTSYRIPAKPLPPDPSPRSVFDRAFKDLQATDSDGSAITALRAQRRSILDTVRRSYEGLAPRLGAADRRTVDQHLATVRELEKRLFAETSSGKGCARPEPTTLGYGSNSQFPAIGRAQTDLLVMALACDLTRVATLQWSHAVGQPTFSWIGVNGPHHTLSHDPDTNLDSKEKLTKINVWYAEQLAYLAQRLKEIPDGTGTLLDSTLVLWCNELARGNAHSHTDMPYLLLGRAGGALRTGRFLKYDGEVPHNNLLVSILNAFDVPATTFGNAKYCTGPLAGLL